MDVWLKEFHELFLHFFGRPTPNETYLLVALCVLFGALALSRISTGLGAIGAFYTTGALMTAAGLAIILAAMALLPVLDFHEWWMPLAVPAAALAVVVVPLTVLFQKGDYVTALIAWTVALSMVAVVLTLEPMTVRMFEKGFEKAVKNGMKLEKNRIETEQFK
ncbi:MAG: hypothetical protein WC334_01560 [Kiritimatiellales bacterium]